MAAIETQTDVCFDFNSFWQFLVLFLVPHAVTTAAKYDTVLSAIAKIFPSSSLQEKNE